MACSGFHGCLPLGCVCIIRSDDSTLHARLYISQTAQPVLQFRSLHVVYCSAACFTYWILTYCLFLGFFWVCFGKKHIYIWIFHTFHLSSWTSVKSTLQLMNLLLYGFLTFKPVQFFSCIFFFFLIIRDAAEIFFDFFHHFSPSIFYLKKKKKKKKVKWLTFILCDEDQIAVTTQICVCMCDP